MATNKVQTGLRLPENIYAKTRALAQMEKRSLNNLIEFALQQYLDEYERAHGEITVDPEE